MKIHHFLVILVAFLCLGFAVYLYFEEEKNDESLMKKEVSYTNHESAHLKNYCEKGEMQSPIQIKNKNVLSQQTPAIEIFYGEEPFILKKQGYTLEAVSKLRVSYITIDKKPYKLDSFHFHVPSEHQIDYQRYDMELHLVHKNNKGKIAVIGVLIEAGKENEMVEELWNFLQDDRLKDKEIESIHLLSLIPEQRSAFYYSGSLTTPPCTEGVHWIVFESPIDFSNKQIASFYQVYGYNSRPLQPINGRDIYKLSVQ